MLKILKWIKKNCTKIFQVLWYKKKDENIISPNDIEIVPTDGSVQFVSFTPTSVLSFKIG